MKKTLIWICMLILLAVNVFGVTCYQESTNQSNIFDGSCELDYSGNTSFFGNWAGYSLGRGYDGLFNTSQVCIITGDCYFSINYTKPLGWTNDSQWLIEVQNDTGVFSKYIDLPFNCLNYSYLSFYSYTDDGVNSSYYCYNSSSYELLLVEDAPSIYDFYEEGMVWDVDQTFTLRTNGLNGLLSSVLYNFTSESLTDSGNPSSRTFISLGINASNPFKLVNLTITDLQNYYTNATFLNYNISLSTTVYNFTLNVSTLNFLFFQNGSLINTSGVAADIEKSINWSNSAFVNLLSNFTDGYVHIRWGLTNNTNHTGFYEFINPPISSINETIEVLRKADDFIYFRVLDLANSPLEDVIVRVYSSYAYDNSPNWTNHSLIGQRLTDNDGYTPFFLDTDTSIYATFEKNGYVTDSWLSVVGDESFPKSDPKLIYLKDEGYTAYDFAYLYINNKFWNRSLNIRGNVIHSDTVSTVSYNTDHRIGLGLSTVDLICNSQNECPITLRSGTDFLTSGSDDINLSIYLDGTLFDYYNIEFVTKTQTFQQQTMFSSVSNQTVAILLFILLIVLSAGLSFLFTSTSIGSTIFKIGGVLLAFVWSGFFWFSIILFLDLIGGLIQTIISE